MANTNVDYDRNDLPVLLPIYYKKLFPYGPFYRWLNYGGVPKTYFCHREFSFTLKDDVYIRYQSFPDQHDMEKEIQKACPYKIDIGAVFSHKPKDHKMVKGTSFQALEKELVFDIDMTDYDDVRKCCSGADICGNCWPLMTIAIKILDKTLEEDFGFDHRLFVYSGRRGIHCWIADETARKLSQNARTAIAEYLSLVKGGENQIKKITLHDPLHPSIVRALSVVHAHFEDLALDKQDILGCKESWDKVLALVPDEALREQLGKDMTKGENSKQRWALLKGRVKKEVEKGGSRKSQLCIQEIMFQYCYPRLDVNVSKGVNHLLKSPFCIHPKTGRVCVPIDAEHAEKFDPTKVPSISQLCHELDNAMDTPETDEPAAKRRRDYKKTSLHTSVKIFDNFLDKLEKSWKGKLIQQSDMKKEF
ncbi:DNA primase small subunit-like [Saccoglossus kowalevskii]|uniref:DNA primase n=1 Tax=Saccoglossus kowalevskii TaxID=10224 RepID=A0ABM0M813_SACKO|nr:PREDICTED: DNA primase small subunit-like [Saccoglossus kowalevskii]